MNIARRALLAFALTTPFAACAQAPAPRAISTREAYDGQHAGTLVLIDIRTPAEWAQTGAPAGALRLDMTAPDFLAKIEAARKAYPGKDIALICRSSNRSAHVAQALAQRGWTNVVDVAGGLAGSPRGKGWIAEGLPVETVPAVAK